jgi:hypothetical protein
VVKVSELGCSSIFLRYSIGGKLPTMQSPIFMLDLMAIFGTLVQRATIAERAVRGASFGHLIGNFCVLELGTAVLLASLWQWLTEFYSGPRKLKLMFRRGSMIRLGEDTATAPKHFSMF